MSLTNTTYNQLTGYLHTLSNLSSYAKQNKVYQKVDTTNISTAAADSVLTVGDVNNLLSSLSTINQFISTLVYSNDSAYSKMWLDPIGYITVVGGNNNPRVTSFNNVTGDVNGVSSIIVNGIEYLPPSCEINLVDIGDRPPNQIVSSFNGKFGPITAANFISMNINDHTRLLDYYTASNSGLIDIGKLKKVLNIDGLNQIVSSFNNVSYTQSKKAYGISGLTYNGIYYSPPTADILTPMTGWIRTQNYAPSSNVTFTGNTLLQNSPDQTTAQSQPKLIVDVQFVHHFIEDTISKTFSTESSLKTLNADIKLGNNGLTYIVTIDISTLLNSEANSIARSFISPLYFLATRYSTSNPITNNTTSNTDNSTTYTRINFLKTQIPSNIVDGSQLTVIVNKKTIDDIVRGSLVDITDAMTYVSPNVYLVYILALKSRSKTYFVY